MHVPPNASLPTRSWARLEQRPSFKQECFLFINGLDSHSSPLIFTLKGTWDKLYSIITRYTLSSHFYHPLKISRNSVWIDRNLCSLNNQQSGQHIVGPHWVSVELKSHWNYTSSFGQINSSHPAQCASITCPLIMIDTICLSWNNIHFRRYF